MNATDRNIWKTLKENLGYQSGETVAIIFQKWHPKLPKETKPYFKRSEKVCQRMFRVLKEKKAAVELLSYHPAKAGPGVDAPKELYERIGKKDIIFMPTAFSLTHTKFTNAQTAKGSRVASMPKFNLSFFEKEGPLDVDNNKLIKLTKQLISKLKVCKSVHLTAAGTDITVKPNKKIVHGSTGMITKGECGNLPGAEAYTCPLQAQGYFTIPRSWGGLFPLKYSAKFIVKDCKVIDILGENLAAQKYIDKKVKPLIFGGKNFNVIAELGLGSNPKVTSKSIKKYGWSALLAEKTAGTAHLANGNSAAMGGKNDVPVHIDWVIPKVEIKFQN